MPAAELSMLLSITAAVLFGGADFVGGVAARRTEVAVLVFWACGLAMVILTVSALVLGHQLPTARFLLAGAAAGACGAGGVWLLYSAMSRGPMSVSAPLSALPGVVIPAAVGAWWLGPPAALTLVGFAVAAVAVWLISTDGSVRPEHTDWATIGLALGSGIAIGFYFVALDAAGQSDSLWPLAVSSGVGVLLMGAYLVYRGQLRLPAPEARWLVLGNGLLDSSANVLFYVAARLGRLDIAAVLTSLYPGVTILLAWAITGERLRAVQWVGVGLAMIAIVMITL